MRLNTCDIPPTPAKRGPQGPEPKSYAEYMHSLSERFGREFLHDLERLKSNPFWNTSGIGKKYGITRERVRQIVKRAFGKEYSYFVAQKRRKLDEEIRVEACAFHPLSKLHTYNMGESSHLSVGILGEAAVYAECQKMGYDVRPSSHVAIDMYINGYAVDVKTCSVTKRASATNKVEYYYPMVSQAQRAVCDYIVVYIKPDESFYIIPCGLVTKNGRLYICKTPSASHKAKNKYERFKDAWDLLRPVQLDPDLWAGWGI